MKVSRSIRNLSGRISYSRTPPKINDLTRRILLILRQYAGSIMYDPNDLSTQFQDNLGTIPVTALGQIVGLTLDKGMGLVRGPDLRPTYTYIQVGSPPAPSFNPVTGQGTLHRVAGGGNTSSLNFPNLKVGGCYAVSVTNNNATGNFSIRRNLTNNVIVSIAAGQTFTGIVDTGTGTNLAVVPNIDGTVIEFTVHEIREIPGAHRIQPTTTSRKTLQARVNVLLSSVDVTAYSRTNTTVTGSPENQLFAATSAGTAYLSTSVLSTTVADNTRVNFFRDVKASGCTNFVIQGKTKGNTYPVCTFDLTAKTAVVASPAGASPVATITELDNGFFRCFMSWNVGSGSETTINTFSIGNDGGTALITPGADGVKGLLVRASDFRLGTDGAFPYQRVVSVTEYTDVGAPRYWQYDGVDDSDYTATTVDFSAVTALTFIAGWKSNDVSDGIKIAVEQGPSYSLLPGRFELSYSELPGNGFIYARRNSSGGNTQYGRETVRSTDVKVISVTSDLTEASGLVVKSNGLNLVPIIGPGTHTSGVNETIYFGRRNNASAPFNGREYASIIIPRLVSAYELAILEAWCASRAGIAI